MDIFRCDQCNAKYKNSEKLAGKKIRCRKCQAVIAVPPLASQGSDGQDSKQTNHDSSAAPAVSGAPPFTNEARQGSPVASQGEPSPSSTAPIPVASPAAPAPTGTAPPIGAPSVPTAQAVSPALGGAVPGAPPIATGIPPQQASGAAPLPGQPVPNQPVPGQPVPGQPVPGQPVPGQPVPGQPVYPQPMPGQPASGQPVYPQPTFPPVGQGGAGMPPQQPPVPQPPIPQSPAPQSPILQQPNQPFAPQPPAQMGMAQTGVAVAPGAPIGAVSQPTYGSPPSSYGQSGTYGQSAAGSNRQRPVGHLRQRPKEDNLLVVFTLILFFVVPLFSVILGILAVGSVANRVSRYEAIQIYTGTMGLGMLGMVIPITLFCIWLYQAWNVIPPRHRSQTPGMAVGLLWVPFFNFVWQFFAIAGLSYNIQQVLKRCGDRNPGAGYGVGIALCVMVCCGFISLVIGFYGIFVYVMLCIWMAMTNGAKNRMIRELYRPEARRSF